MNGDFEEKASEVSAVNGCAASSARKSNRRLKRGEKKIIVSSDLVLQKFKIRVKLKDFFYSSFCKL